MFAETRGEGVSWCAWLCQYGVGSLCITSRVVGIGNAAVVTWAAAAAPDLMCQVRPYVSSKRTMSSSPR